ncbi:hypothetical protein KFU94_41090 [Chloroflexi bacterium TSY]|nr:hypothetical protein [Chloroflexi bacterium TSY]
MVEQAYQIREAVRPDMDLAIDLHGRYNATAGAKLAHALEPLNLIWLEESVPPENIDAMAEIYYISFAPHNNSSALSTVADAHVCTANGEGADPLWQ